MRCPGVPDAGVGVGRLRQAFALVGVALALGGCITAQGSSSYQSQAGVPPPHPPDAVTGARKVAVEGDGLPRQLPPRRRASPEKDDPSEPFSPNYGPPPVGGEAPSAVAKPPVHKVRMSETEVARVIGAAIVAHEKRRP